MRGEVETALFEELAGPDKGRWSESLVGLEARLKERGCVYGDRVITKALRPKLLTEGDYADLVEVCAVLTDLLRRLVPRVLAEPALRSYLGLTAAELALCEPEPRCPDPLPFVRLDSFITENGPQFVEMNGECPAGPGFVDRSLEVLSEHPLFAAFVERSGARALLAQEGLRMGILRTWRASGGMGVPTVLITDDLTVSTASEFEMIAEQLRAHGIPTIVEDPRALSFQDGRLVAKGEAIDYVYRRLLSQDVFRLEAEIEPLLRAYREGAIVMANPFRAKTVHKKAAFGLLTGDLIGQDWMTAHERAIVKRTIPWTAKLREGHVQHAGQRVDLVPHIAANRERFVLKPNDDYGGRGITLGWTVDDATWIATLGEALANDYVVQERVWTVQEPFPMADHGLEQVPQIVDLDPYVYCGRLHGVLARLGAGELCNVTSGGGQVPVMLLPTP